jgi:hypothetical protein
MELTGTIKVIRPTQQITDAFKKREFVIETAGEYPQPILLEMVQDKCDVLNKYAVGQQVTVAINLRGREWTNKEGEVKYFNSIQAWRISEGNTSESQAVSNESDLPF